MGVIRKNEGGANKDLKKFTEEINRLCDKWAPFLIKAPVPRRPDRSKGS